MRAFRRLFTTVKPTYMPVVSVKDEKVMKRIDIERKALILHQQEKYKQGKIEPMIHIIEKIQEAVKNGIETPSERLENVLTFTAEDSYNSFLKKYESCYGNLAMELYGDEKDLRQMAIENRGEIIPSRLHDEKSMVLYRKYYVTNYTMPGCIENINPNKFIRIKPIHEFALLPIEPIAPTVLKRYYDELFGRKKEGYKFKIDKGEAISFLLVVGCFVVFFYLIFFLYKTDENRWVRLSEHRKTTQRKQYGVGN